MAPDEGVAHELLGMAGGLGACAAVGAEVFSAPTAIDLPGRGKCRSMLVRNPGSGAARW